MESYTTTNDMEHYAANGDTETIKRQIDQGRYMDLIYNGDLLFVACQNKQYDTVEYLLTINPDRELFFSGMYYLFSENHDMELIQLFWVHHPVFPFRSNEINLIADGIKASIKSGNLFIVQYFMSRGLPKRIIAEIIEGAIRANDVPTLMSILELGIDKQTICSFQESHSHKFTTIVNYLHHLNWISIIIDPYTFFTYVIPPQGGIQFIIPKLLSHILNKANFFLESDTIANALLLNDIYTLPNSTIQIILNYERLEIILNNNKIQTKWIVKNSDLSNSSFE